MRCRATIVAVEITITYTEGVFVALGTQDGMRISHIVICGCPARQQFSTLPHKRYDFTKKNIENKMYVVIPSTILA
jgi:hypothetical protein